MGQAEQDSYTYGHMALKSGRPITKVSSGRFQAEASDLGLEPGLWPAILTLGLEGRRYDLERRWQVENRGEFVGWRYSNRTGDVELLVLND